MSTKKLENKTGMPVNLIIDEIKCECPRKRIASIQNLNLIASTIGPERSRNELVPYLNELLDDEDEVLLELIVSLSGNFTDYLGGQQYLVILLPILEALCRVEEVTVRDKSALLIKRILNQPQGDAKKQDEIVMGVLRRLNESDYFMSKSCLCMLIPSLIQSVLSASQIELVGIYVKLITDSIPSVRKYASMNFKEMVKLYPLVSEVTITNSIQTFLKDDQDFIRMFQVDSLIAITKTQLYQKNPLLCSNFFKQLAEDSSWRVRYYFCDKIAEICTTCGKEQYKKNYQVYHFKFIQDQEPELKSIAALRIADISEDIDADDIVNKLIPLLKGIQNDTNAFVRSSLASSVLTLCPNIGKKSTSEQILPIFLQLLKDQDSDVRITLFKKMSHITKVLGVESLSQSVIPALTELAQDKNWRIRAQTIEVLGFFAKAIGSEFLSEKIIKLLLDWLSDKVFAVREAAVVAVRQLVEILGVQWADKNLLHKVLNLSTNPNYLHRLTVLFTITQIAQLHPHDSLFKNILPILQTLSKDPVANVRLNVCVTIKSTQQHFKEKDMLKKIIMGLQEDSDIDVKYNAKLAQESI